MEAAGERARAACPTAVVSLVGCGSSSIHHRPGACKTYIKALPCLSCAPAHLFAECSSTSVRCVLLHVRVVCSCTSVSCVLLHICVVCSCSSSHCAPASNTLTWCHHPHLVPTPSPGANTLTWCHKRVATTLTWCQHPHLVPQELPTPSPGATRVANTLTCFQHPHLVPQELPPPSPGANTLTWCHKSCQHPHLVPTPSPGATRVVASVSQPYSHILMPYCCNCSSFRLPEGGGQLLAEGLRAFGHHFFLCGVCQQHFSQVRGGVLHDARQGQMDIMCLGLRVA